MYTFDGMYIRDLDTIPENTRIIIVSENAPPKEQESRLIVSKDFDCSSDIHGGSQAFSLADSQPELVADRAHEIKGLRNNIYDYDSK